MRCWVRACVPCTEPIRSRKAWKNCACCATSAKAKRHCAITGKIGPVLLLPVLTITVFITHFVAAKYDITDAIRKRSNFRRGTTPSRICPTATCCAVRCKKIQSAGPDSTPFWVAFLDLDNFKLVNDTLGHTQGDLVLLEVCMTAALHEHDIVARRGGDGSSFFSTTQSPQRTGAEPHHVGRRGAQTRHAALFLGSTGRHPPQDGNDPDLLISAPTWP